jgi:hypothetical protein
MRRILIDRARHKNSRKAGGEYQRAELIDIEAPADPSFADVLALHEALAKLEQKDPRAVVQTVTDALACRTESVRLQEVVEYEASISWPHHQILLPSG